MNLAPPLSALLLLAAAAVGAADFSKVTELRRSGDYTQAAKLLKNYASPADYDSLPATERMEFLQGVLELAHVKALQDDVPGALALLNWAENLSEPYPRAYSCVKYAEILLDIGEPERARGYLKSFDEVKVTNAKSDERGKAIGQGGRNADLGAAWRELAERAELLKAQAEFVELKEKFGATYANYVKLRRLQKQASKSKPDYESAMALADEIIKSAPDSQFAGAAGYLKGEIMAAHLTEESPKREIEAVKKYLRSFAEGRGASSIPQAASAYRGEALMLLGKISLEIEWDAKESEKHYSAALAHFREARAKRDAVSLYAPLTEELKQQVTPTKKLTTLNEWKRIVYHSEDPLKLYNTAVAPPWYVDEKEKDCIYNLGFLAFAAGDYDAAWGFWSQIARLDAEQQRMDAANFPNVIMRLRAVCEQREFMFSEKQRKCFSGKNRLKLLYAELLHYEERFHLAGNVFSRIAENQQSSNIEKAAAYIGLTEYALMSWTAGKSVSERKATFQKYPEKALKLSENTLLHESALRMCALFLAASTKTCAESIPYFKQFFEKYPESKYSESMLLRLGIVYAQEEDYAKADEILKRLKNRNYVEIMERTIKFKKGELK